MTYQTLIRYAALLVTAHAKTHAVLDHAFGNRHRCQITMARRALHSVANVGRMIEADMRLFDKSVNTLPCKVFTPLGSRAQHLDPRIAWIADVLMACHAQIDARQSRARPLRDARMAILAFDPDLVKMMNPMRKIDRLHGLGPDL
jgi:hypothetical protein